MDSFFLKAKYVVAGLLAPEVMVFNSNLDDQIDRSNSTWENSDWIKGSIQSDFKSAFGNSNLFWFDPFCDEKRIRQYSSIRICCSGEKSSRLMNFKTASLNFLEEWIITDRILDFLEERIIIGRQNNAPEIMPRFSSRHLSQLSQTIKQARKGKDLLIYGGLSNFVNWIGSVNTGNSVDRV